MVQLFQIEKAPPDHVWPRMKRPRSRWHARAVTARVLDSLLADESAPRTAAMDATRGLRARPALGLHVEEIDSAQVHEDSLQQFCVQVEDTRGPPPLMARASLMRPVAMAADASSSQQQYL